MNLFYVAVLNSIDILELLFSYIEHIYNVPFPQKTEEIQLTVEFYIKLFEDYFFISVENIFVLTLSIIILLIVLKKCISMAKEIGTKHAFNYIISR